MAGMIQTQAEAVGASLATNPDSPFPQDKNDPTFIDPAMIIGIAQLLLGFLSSCWKNQNSAGLTQGYSKPSDYLADHYNAETGQFEETVISQVRGQTRRVIRTKHREHGGPRLRDLSEEQVTAISTQSLLQIMTTPGADISCLAEVTM